MQLKSYFSGASNFSTLRFLASTMSEGTKSLNAKHKPDPKPDVTPPEAADSATGPVELTAMVILFFSDFADCRQGRKSFE
jgi:hypothetical protein